MSEFVNPIAELDRPDSGRTIKPEDAYPVRDELRLFCPDHDCKDIQRRLKVRPSSLGNPYFYHLPGFGHDILPETLLHKLAIKWFVGRTAFEIPSHELNEVRMVQQVVSIDAEKTVCEYRKLERIIPDVKLVTSTGFEFAIEIVVTHDVDESKRKLIREFNLPTLRVDLHDFYKANPTACRTDADFVSSNLDKLLSDILLKSWVIKPDKNFVQDKLSVEPLPPKSDSPGCANIIVIGFVIWIFRKIF